MKATCGFNAPANPLSFQIHHQLLNLLFLLKFISQNPQFYSVKPNFDFPPPSCLWSPIPALIIFLNLHESVIITNGYSSTCLLQSSIYQHQLNPVSAMQLLNGRASLMSELLINFLRHLHKAIPLRVWLQVSSWRGTAHRIKTLTQLRAGSPVVVVNFTDSNLSIVYNFRKSEHFTLSKNFQLSRVYRIWRYK